jgi:hypothetical protein
VCENSFNIFEEVLEMARETLVVSLYQSWIRAIPQSDKEEMSKREAEVAPEGEPAQQLARADDADNDARSTPRVENESDAPFSAALLDFYYKYCFPFDLLYRWLSYGNGTWPFGGLLSTEFAHEIVLLNIRSKVWRRCCRW